jgi:DNA repair protein RadC
MSDRPYASPEAHIVQLVRDDARLADRVLRLLMGEPCTDAVVSPEQAVAVILPLLVGREHEALVVVALDSRRRVVDVAVLTVGCEGCTIVDPQQIFRWALTRSRPSASIILAHNHPSGDTTPSAADRRASHKVAAAGRVLGIPLADHIVVTDAGAWASMAEMGLLTPS